MLFRSIFFSFRLFSMLCINCFRDTGFVIKLSILTVGIILENSSLLISNADIKIVLIVGRSALIFLISSYPFIEGILISDITRAKSLELFRKCSNASNGSVKAKVLQRIVYSRVYTA